MLNVLHFSQNQTTSWLRSQTYSFYHNVSRGKTISVVLHLHCPHDAQTIQNRDVLSWEMRWNNVNQSKWHWIRTFLPKTEDVYVIKHTIEQRSIRYGTLFLLLTLLKKLKSILFFWQNVPFIHSFIALLSIWMSEWNRVFCKRDPFQVSRTNYVRISQR